MMEGKLAWGVLGTGNIVRKAGPAIQASALGRWLGVAGRNADNSRRAAEQYGVERAYPDYQALLDDPDIDAVYIALLNHLHKEWAVKAAAAGKHVLLEKPFALNMQEALAIRDAALANGVAVMEAHVWRFYPAFPELKRMIDEGAIGELAMVQAHFSFVAAPTSTRLVKEWGGGSLYDVGCYPVAWSRYFFGCEPIGADGRFLWHPETGVGVRFAGTLDFGGGRTALISSALDMALGSRFDLFGTRGVIRVVMRADADALTIWAEGPFGERTWTSDRISPFSRQADAFAAGVLEGGGPPFGLDDALGNQAAIDALFQSARESRHIPIDQARRQRRKSPE
jgi:predicted dehydrogenase